MKSEVLPLKSLEEYMQVPYRMVLIPDRDESGFVVSFPDLPGCLSTGSTYEEAIRNAQDAKRDWLIAAMEERINIPIVKQGER